LLVPIAFVYACVRLWVIAVNVKAGRSRLKAGPASARTIGVCLAYGGLWVYTLAMLVFAARVVFTVGVASRQFGEAFAFLALYPVAVVLAEWCFFHGLERAPA
jgi:hypothetical protein